MNEEMKYIHCLDLSNKLKVLNLTSTSTISSLLTVQLFTNDKRDNPMVIDIEKLRNCTVDEINGMSSPRMLFVFQRTILNSWTHRSLTDSEKVLVKKGDLEIEFERGRREYNYGAPSRLSALYLMEDSLDSRMDLRSMFIDIFPNPFVAEVSILNRLELMKFDYHWVEQYYQDPKEDYIKNYWTSVSFNEKEPKWEYLLEGTIKMTNREQFEAIQTFVQENHPDEYHAILLTRAELENKKQK